MNAQKSSTKTAGRSTTSKVWTDVERAAMQEHAKEMKTAARRGKLTREDGEADVRAKIEEMNGSDRAIAERLHAIITETAPDLVPRTWYGFPAYARDNKIVCFFKPAEKYKTRYATLGFEEAAQLDDGKMWPTSWAVTELTPADEARVAELVRKAAAS
jgi:hypothetical protein